MTRWTWSVCTWSVVWRARCWWVCWPPRRALAINGVAGVSKGLFYGGGWDQLERQAIGAFSVLFYSAIVTLIIALILKYTIGLRLSPEAEAAGIDESQHAESGYDFATATGSVLPHASLPDERLRQLEDRVGDKVEAE